MDRLDKGLAGGLFENCDPRCLSLYQPTHRRRPDNEQDRIRFGFLVKALEESLLQQVPK